MARTLLPANSLIVIDGSGERWEVMDWQATFTLRSEEDPNRYVKISSYQLRDLGIEWDGRTLKEVG